MVVFGTVFMATAEAALSHAFLMSIPTANGEPTRIAADDTSGMIYVAVPTSGKIYRFYQDGTQAGTINGFKRPLSVAADSNGRLYVGDLGDRSVSVMSPDGQFLFSLGSGNNEFGVPGDIAIGPNGFVYVTDSSADRVKVYASDGVFQFSFGGTGTAAGLMSFPTGITVDNANQEIYVVDQTNGRVEVFDLAGVYKRVIGRFGSGAGKLTRPQGISVAGGRVFVVDAYQSSVEVFDTAGNTVNVGLNAGGTAIPFIGQYGTGPGGLKVPTDTAMVGSRLFVSNTDNARIEVFEIMDPQGLKTSPTVLSFSTAMGVNPPLQTIQVDPQVAGNAVAWTASVSAPFIFLSQTSGTTPAAVNVSIDTTGMAAGTYTGSVIFHSEGNNTDYSVAVSLTIVQPQLSVSSAGVDMTYRKGNGLPAAQAITVDSTGGSVQWTAVADALWTSLSGASGATPAALAVSANQNSDALAEGQYNANVTITAPGAANSPAVVPVRLRVVVAGTVTVTTNLDSATFALTGPVTYTGSGKTWTMDEVKAGAYTVEFGMVKGYRKPASRTVTVQSGQTITIDGLYQPNVANAIIAAKGPDPKNDALVRVFDLNGNLINEFKAFTSKYGARVAAGDIDGDGSDEIVVAPGPGVDNKASVKIFRADGSAVASSSAMSLTAYGAQIAIGDINGDGRAEIAMSMTEKETKAQTVVVYSVDNNYNFREISRVSLQQAEVKYPAAIVFGDTDGDGILELVAAPSGSIVLFRFDEAFAATQIGSGAIQANTDDYKSLLTVSAGDLNGDGTDEIMIGYTDGTDSLVQALNGDLTNAGLSIKAFEKGKASPNLSLMDWDGSGTAEVLSGAGALSQNDAVIKAYDANGVKLREIRAFEGSRYGVNAAFGAVKR